MRLWENESGVALTEYVLILALIALAAFLGMNSYGQILENKYSYVGNQVDQSL